MTPRGSSGMLSAGNHDSFSSACAACSWEKASKSRDFSLEMQRKGPRSALRLCGFWQGAHLPRLKDFAGRKDSRKIDCSYSAPEQGARRSEANAREIAPCDFP